MALVENKSALARLLAGENITVRHENLSTAYFDLKNRTLMCPVWKDMDGDLYDLLMGHEVGHALETPAQGWHDAIESNKEFKKFKTFLNVIEDARIERKIKARYPGLSRSFANAYKQLLDNNFFGIKDLDDVNKLNLIDRINVRFKLSPHIAVGFSDAEREYVRRVEQADTWDDVVVLAREIYQYVRDNEQDKIQNLDNLQDYIADKKQEAASELGGDESEDDADMESYDEYDGDSDASGDESESSDDSEESSSDSQSAGGENSDEEIQSATDQSFRKHEGSLINETGKVVFADMPQANLSKIIKPNALVVKDFERYIRSELTQSGNVYGRNKVTFEQIVSKSVAKFLKNNKKFITHMHLEFERRKQAAQFARTKTAKTGELDMNKLSNYKFSNDLFKKISVVGNGKSHGMIMFLDMSGSMHPYMGNTFEQLLVLASFCRLTNIPFDVYGFSSDHSLSLSDAGLGQDQFSNNEGEAHVYSSGSSFHLIHLISSELNSLAYKRAYNMIAVLAAEYNNWEFRNWQAAGLGLDGTPFIETLIASRDIIEAFKSRHNRDVVNVVYLTDGEGSTCMSLPSNRTDTLRDVWRGAVYFVDKKSKKKIRVANRNNMQAALTQLIGDVTGCKHIGFYLTSDRDLRYFMKGANVDANKAADIRKSMRDHNFFAIPYAGYASYFVTKIAAGEIQEKELNVNNGMTKSQMAKAFKSALGSKKSSRVLVSRFAEEISG